MSHNMLLHTSMTWAAGGFQCQCWLGWTGDGVKACTPTPALSDLASQYTNEATQGPLICDVAYPLNAPGSAYDPTLNTDPAKVSSSWRIYTLFYWKPCFGTSHFIKEALIGDVAYPLNALGSAYSPTLTTDPAKVSGS